MTIANLMKVVPPPAEPFWAYKGPWAAIEGELGTALPQDYKDYVAVYGSGDFMRHLTVFLPKSWSANLRLGAQVKLFPWKFYDVSKDVVGNLPYPLWPEPGGLMVFGGTSGGDHLFWLMRGATNEAQMFKCGMTDFFTGIATGTILSGAFDAEALARGNKFEPCSEADVRRVMDDPAEAADRLRAWRLSWTQVAKGTWGYVPREPLSKSH